MKHMLQNFQNPPALYRPAPLWVWNDEMTKEAIERQIEEMHTHGFGGAFVHPRPGLISSYLTDEWFALWGFALDCAKKRGMKLYIYDENSYPSGFAGGEVSSALPDALANGAAYEILPAKDAAGLREEIIAAFPCAEVGGALAITGGRIDMPQRDWAKLTGDLFVVTRAKAATTGWLAGFAYVDLMRAEAQAEFMRTTYDKYHAHFGDDFGGAVPAIFTDEPYVGSGGVYGSGKPALPFSHWFAGEFRKINGYSLLDNLPCVFRNVEGDFDHPATKVRFDYYRTIHKLWTDNWIAPTGAWCEERGIAWTGHYLEHQWPHVSVNTSPSMQAHYEYHQWPAIDMLLSNYLRETPSHALALTIRELRSSVNQFGKARALCELYGAGGWDSTFEDYKRMGDWVLVNGVNFINQHLTYATITGARKRDHPQSFDWREPWWDEYTQMNDYLGRASYMLTRGKMEQRILLINPSTTGYLVPAEEEKGNIFSDGKVDAIQNPDMTGLLTLSQKLTDAQWDFDYGDEYTLARHARAEAGKLSLIEQAYDVVMISGDTKNLLQSTVSLIEDCARAGVKVLTVGAPGPYVDGLADEAAYARIGEIATDVELARVDAYLAELLPRRVRASAAFPEGLAHMRRALPEGGEVWFFVNHAMEPFEADVTIPGAGVTGLDLFTGETFAIAHTAAGGEVTFELSLARNQSILILSSDESAAQPQAKPVPTREVALAYVSAAAEDENVMPIARVSVDGGAETDILRAADAIFAERGFDGNPWDNKVQFRGNILSRNAGYGKESGFAAAYRFEIAAGFVPTRITVAAEHPELCRLRVNGADAAWIAGETYLDEHIGVADITGLVKSGENVVEVMCDVFDARLELEPIYLRGAFAVEAGAHGFVIAPPKPFGRGAWGAQGMPFYPHAARYTYRAALDEKPAVAALSIGAHEATCVSATVNGAYAGLINADGVRPLDIAAHLKAGENEIVIRVSGGFKNLLGPHFNTARGSAWPGMWKNAPLDAPACEEYDFIAYGMTEDAKLTIG